MSTPPAWPRNIEAPAATCRRGRSRRARSLRPMAPQFIFTMRDLRRFYPPDREVLKGINISMFPGAKIGVLGANGSGKSSLLRIMAGDDHSFQGEARGTPRL